MAVATLADVDPEVHDEPTALAPRARADILQEGVRRRNVERVVLLRVLQFLSSASGGVLRSILCVLNGVLDTSQCTEMCFN